MKEDILNNQNNPAELEKLYRSNKALFKQSFNVIFRDIMDSPVARVWNERLNYENEEISWGTKGDLIFVFASSIIAGLIAKLPEIMGIGEEYFYPRNLSFIVFPFLAAFFSWKFKQSITGIFIVSAGIVASAIYINLLPDNPLSHTLILACIHMPVFLWSLTGFAYVGEKHKSYQRRLDFLRFNGDLIVMTTVILLAGILLAGITIGLFSLIDLQIEEVYFRYIGIWGLAASPILGTFLVQTNPQMVNKVSPVIARVFTPLTLLTLVVYLIAVIVNGKDPYNDRDFLILFNLMLIGVMAIILFSVVEISGSVLASILLLSLAVVAIAVNSIALSAIIFRISEWGISPNRLAVLGGNILILSNLLVVAYQFFRSFRDENKTEKVAKSIAFFLPVYAVWAMVVTFVFPFVFSFR